ncbi:MAG: hypothetical protein E7313_03255 [Clostridiales bacterium]|nr:hypothetical protein [Clostridiales bacterium]
MINKRVVKIFLLCVIMLVMFSGKVYCANYNIDVNFDGKKIEMVSETPDMVWDINNILPGEKHETVVKFSNVGKKDTTIEFYVTIQEDSMLMKALNLTVVRLSDNKEVFNGKYNEIDKLREELVSKKSEEYKFITELPINAGNEFQEKKCSVKLTVVAIGVIDKEGEEKKEIVTEEIKSPQTGQSRVIFIIAIVLIVSIVMLLITFLVRKK